VRKVSIPDTDDTVELFIYDSAGERFHKDCLSKCVSNNNEN
jgi:hypothetical protein